MRHADALTWWPQRAAQRIRVSLAVQERGYAMRRVVVTSDAFRDALDDPGVMNDLLSLAGDLSCSLLVRNARKPGSVKLVSIVYAHDGIASWIHDNIATLAVT